MKIHIFYCLILMLFTGCTSTKQLIASFPHSSDGQEIEHELFAVDGFSMAIRSTNFFEITDMGKKLRGNYYRYIDYEVDGRNAIQKNRDVFFIEFIVFAKHRPLTISPSGFVILSGDELIEGGIYGPVSVSSGWERYSSYNMCNLQLEDPPGSGNYYTSHPNAFSPTDDIKLVSPIRLEKEKKYCFVVKFRMPPPDPEGFNFSFTLGGLDTQQLQARPITIDFKPKLISETHN